MISRLYHYVTLNVTTFIQSVATDLLQGTSYTFKLYSDQLGYDLVDSGTHTFTIIPKTLTATLTGNNVFTKVYDGTTTLAQKLGSNYTLSGIVGSEQADIASSASISGTYADKNAGDNKTLTLSGMCTMAAVHQMMMCSFRRGQMNMY